MTLKKKNKAWLCGSECINYWIIKWSVIYRAFFWRVVVSLHINIDINMHIHRYR